MKALRDEMMHAVKAAWEDFFHNRGGYFNGPATPLYLAIKRELHAFEDAVNVDGTPRERVKKGE